jgi:hypothetical protein
VTNMHIEKNVYRNNDTCKGDTSEGRCGFAMASPEPSTSCGTADGPGDCTSGPNGTGSNVGGDGAPTSWGGDKIPHSLYRVSEQPPSWWCEESCSWSDVHAGIGAWGDDFSGQLCKLPAQILAEGGTCTVDGRSTEWVEAPYPPVILAD